VNESALRYRQEAKHHIVCQLTCSRSDWHLTLLGPLEGPKRRLCYLHASSCLQFVCFTYASSCFQLFVLLTHHHACNAGRMHPVCVCVCMYVVRCPGGPRLVLVTAIVAGRAAGTEEQLMLNFDAVVVSNDADWCWRTPDHNWRSSCCTCFMC
jgi:hypothetical protein